MSRLVLCAKYVSIPLLPLPIPLSYPPYLLSTILVVHSLVRRMTLTNRHVDANTSIPLAKCEGDQDWYCCPGDAECSCDTGKNAVKLGAEQ